jgi:hypothetical protein
MSQTYSTAQQFFINQLRSMISMREQKAAGSSYVLNTKLGDDELWEDLRLGLNMFNTTPPIFTSYSFADLYSASASAEANGDNPFSPTSENSLSVFMTTVLMCAMFFTGLRLQWFEAGKHFRYNDNGISIERVKQPDYQNVVGANILAYISTTLPLIRKSLALTNFHIKGQFSGLVAFPRSLTRGLRGTRLGMG